MNRPNKNKLVWLTWVDAASETSRADATEIAGITLATNQNVGWIIHEDQYRVVLAHGFSNTGEIDHFTIPRGNIISIEPAAVTQRKRKEAGKDAQQAPVD